MDADQKVRPRRLKGFQDYSPQVMAQRLKIIEHARLVAKGSGFQEIATPALEYSEVLLGVGQEIDKQVFRFKDGGDRDVSMRFDLTVPFARYVGENGGKLPLPFKRLQIGDVWRAEKPQKGRFREFCQCDLDIIGADSAHADIEITQTFAQILKQSMPMSFTIYCNNRTILTSLLKNKLGLQDLKAQQEAMIILDKIHKRSRTEIIDMFTQATKCNKTQVENFLDLLKNLQEQDTPNLEPHLNSSEDLADWQRFSKTIDTLKQLCEDKTCKIKIDLSLARGLGYYTGFVFETLIDEKPSFGSICSGGRYNHLAQRFTRQELPGIGGSIGVDRLTALLLEQQTHEAKNPCEFFVAIAADEALPYAFKVAKYLRQHGFATDIALKEQKLSAQFKHANRQAFAYVVTVGDEEMRAQTVNLRNMTTGEEHKGIALKQLQAQVSK